MTEQQDLIKKNDLQGAQKSVGNAFTLYVRTRPPASAESVSRSKALPKEGIHPILAAALPESTLTSLDGQVGLFFLLLSVFMLFCSSVPLNLSSCYLNLWPSP